MVREKDILPARPVDASGRIGVPLELKILGILRILGRSWCLDDVNEASGISESTMCRIFHSFCKGFVLHYYNAYITQPEGEDFDRVREVYEALGLPGAIGSIDGVHVKWDKCPVQLFNLCKGKETYPTLGYLVIVDHNRRILFSTKSFYGAINDKTMVKVCKYVQDVKFKRIYSDKTFKIMDEAGVETDCSNWYFISDNGFHEWVCLIPPSGVTSDADEKLWSEWLESVRKDVECAFGILKGRFRFLRNGIQLHKQKDIDNVFFTCLILHNMLLKVDGLDKYELGAWDDVDPQEDNNDDLYDDNGDPILPRNVPAPAQAIRQINPVLYDVPLERDPTHREFKSKLIAHFNYKDRRNELRWPRKVDSDRKRSILAIRRILQRAGA